MRDNNTTFISIIQYLHIKKFFCIIFTYLGFAEKTSIHLLRKHAFNMHKKCLTLKLTEK